MGINLYEEDENLWRDQMVELLEKGELNSIDTVNLKVMLIEMGKSEQRSVLSQMEELLLHLLKAEFQPEMATRSWLVSINKQRDALGETFKDSKSLMNRVKSNFDACYKKGRKYALTETGLEEKDIPKESFFDFDYAMSEEVPESLKKFVRTDS